MNSYQAMTSILKPNIKPSDEEIKSINSFFFARWMSNNKHTVPIASVINTFYNIPIKSQFKFAQDYSDLVGLPGKVKFIGFDKEKISDEMEKLLSNIERKYKVSRTSAQEYFDLMLLTDEGKLELDKLFTLYDTGLQK